MVTARNRNISSDQLLLFEPESNWAVPSFLPDLRGKVAEIAFDTEERDNGLADGKGSGWPRGSGHICGMSVAWREGETIKSFYAPTQHPDTTCFAQERAAEWVQAHADAGVRFITHHGAHDWGWIRKMWGVRCPPQRADTEAEAMLVDENRLSYKLDRLCQWRGFPGKDDRVLRESASAFGIPEKQVMENIWKLPARYVGDYAEQDARATLLLHENLMQEIETQELTGPLQLELDLIPMVLEMRLRGVRVNLDAAEQSRRLLLAERDRVLVELSDRLGRRIGMDECRSAAKLEALFVEQRIPIPFRTEKTGQASFQAKWMKKHEHWLPRGVAKAEQLTDMVDKFLTGFIFGYVADNNRIHASINQYRGEEGGTRSFRFSYADPPLQQAPARDEQMSEIFRGVFEPEEGEMWLSVDQKQQEFMLIVHFAALARCQKVELAVERYHQEPYPDFHSLVAEWTGLDRKPAKDTNFAKAYGAGISKFASMIGQSEDRAREIMDQYDRELPFVKELNRVCMQLADERGYIRLLDGTRSHFNQWERKYFNKGIGYEPPAQSYMDAIRKWPGAPIRRAHTHKAMNRLIQGSAARQTKLWMRECWREGIVPLLQMHDELCVSVPSKVVGDHIQYLGEHAIELKIPTKTDAEYGPTWGQAKYSWDEAVALRTAR